MFNKNLLKGKSVSYKKLNYATFANGLNTDIDEYTLPINHSVNTFNFNYSNGALTTGLGIKKLWLPISTTTISSGRYVELPLNKQAKACWFYRFVPSSNIFRFDFLVVQTTDNNFIYQPIYTSINGFSTIPNLTIEDVPKVINYNINGEDSLILSSKQGLFVWSHSNSEEYNTISNAPNIESMCVHYERVFATTGGSKQEVWFSKELDPTNWNVSLNDGGYIVLNDERGQCNKVISFNDHVYVFRDYGISRITAYANQTEFNVSHLFVSSGQIYSNTICTCGDRIIMLTENGLYAFDGNSTYKLNLYINNLLSKSKNRNAIAAYFNGKYYLACHIDFDDKQTIGSENLIDNNVLLELDIKTNTINLLRGVDVRHLCVIVDNCVSKLVACVCENSNYMLGEITNCGKFFDTPTEKQWVSPLSDFGYPEKYKIVKDIYITSKYPIQVVVRTENTKQVFDATPTNNLVHISTIIKGKQIAVDFISKEAECYISSPKIVVGIS